MAFIRSRVAGAVLGLVIIGTGGAALAAATTPPPAQTAGSSTLAVTSATKTATGVASKPTATPTSAPTATTPPPPPPIPPTPTPAVGSSTLVQGTVMNVITSASPQYFVVQSSSGRPTIDVNGSTQFSGKATSLSTLQPDWQVSVTGIVQADGSILATTVHSSNDN